MRGVPRVSLAYKMSISLYILNCQFIGISWDEIHKEKIYNTSILVYLCIAIHVSR